MLWNIILFVALTAACSAAIYFYCKFDQCRKTSAVVINGLTKRYRELLEDYERLEEAIDREHKEVLKIVGAYQALEQGMDEQEENYEQQFLTFKEQILAMKEYIETQNAILLWHNENCLPDVDHVWVARTAVEA